MRTLTRLLLVLALAGTASRSVAGAQAPVGPVAPTAPRLTIGDYEAGLAAGVKGSADDALWNASTDAERARLVANIGRMTQAIKGLPIGPVAPAPPVRPVPPSTGPGTPAPPRATKDTYTQALESLMEALKEARRVNPDYQLPADLSTSGQVLIERLGKATPP